DRRRSPRRPVRRSINGALTCGFAAPATPLAAPATWVPHCAATVLRGSVRPADLRRCADDASGERLMHLLIQGLGVRVAVDEAGRVRLVGSVPLLHPEQQTVEEMLDGWRNQQLSRNLQFGTIDQRIRYVRRFIDHVNEFPWRWTPAM